MNANNNVNLKSFHTFGMDVPCDVLVEATTVDDLVSAYRCPEWQERVSEVLG